MMRCRCMECDIRRMTFGVRSYREYLELERELTMALELKGLKAKAIKARSAIDGLNAAYDAFNAAAPAHAADVAGLTEQISGMEDDLKFAVTTLGNSVGVSEKLTEGPLTLADLEHANTQTTAEQPSPSPPEVGQEQPHFQP